MNRRRLRSIVQRLLSESFVPLSALDNNFIPAGTLEDILEIDGHQEFTEELSMYCEMLEGGNEYFIMERAVYKFIMRAMHGLASDPAEPLQTTFISWYEISRWDTVRIEKTVAAINSGMAGANYIKWSMR